MVVPSIRLVHSRWSDAHVFEAEANGGRSLDHVAVVRSYEVDPRPRRRWPPNWLALGSVSSGAVFNEDMDDIRHHRGIVRHMPVVAEKQLQRMLTRAQRKFNLRLTSSEVHMIKIAWYLLIHGRQGRVDEKVMVAAAGPVICCGGYFYAAGAEPYDCLGWYS